MNVSHPGCPGSRAVERVCFSFVVSKASIPSRCLNTTNAVVCDVNENMFVCSYVVCTYVKLPCCVCAGSSMEFQCFEIQIKTEADSNECPHDDKPSTGMFAGSDDIFSALSSSRGFNS